MMGKPEIWESSNQGCPNHSKSIGINFEPSPGINDSPAMMQCPQRKADIEIESQLNINVENTNQFR